MHEHEKWAREAANGESLRAIARAINVNEGNFSRQIKNGLDADRVIQIARAYQQDIIQALIDTGHIDLREVPEVRNAQIGAALDRIISISEEVKTLQSDYGLVADSSPREGEGAPDDYEP